MTTISIIGGTGEFGRVFARVFSREGYEVLITGRDEAKGRRVASEVGARFVRDNRSAAAQGDVVIVSVPIESTVGVIEEVAPEVREGSLLTDFTSVKVEPCRAMLKHAAEGVEVVGMHPMFGPRVPSLEGMVFILTPLRTGRWWEWLQGWLQSHRARVVVTTPEEHDRMMSVVQCMTHFTYISAASTLRELGVDVKETRKFASPVYELMLDLIARIVGQNPHLYASIQLHNPFAGEVRRRFVESALRLREVLDSGRREEFVRIMADAAKHMGDVTSAMGRSDKAIAALKEEFRRLKESRGREVALRHIYSGAVHVGVVEEVEPESVTLRCGRRRLRLKLANVELLPEQEVLRIKAQRLPHETRDFSVLLPEHASPEVIAGLVRGVRGVLECTPVEEYRGRGIPEGMKSVLFRVKGVEADFEEVERLLTGIGGRLR
ncbi:MAG: prephenate dehydrogenase [Euryarchaeota archaeon]|nr:prephenate dehydrogenase [Euryarchaeota archaeon]